MLTIKKCKIVVTFVAYGALLGGFAALPDESFAGAGHNFHQFIRGFFQASHKKPYKLSSDSFEPGATRYTEALEAGEKWHRRGQLSSFGTGLVLVAGSVYTIGSKLGCARADANQDFCSRGDLLQKGEDAIAPKSVSAPLPLAPPVAPAGSNSEHG